MYISITILIVLLIISVYFAVYTKPKLTEDQLKRLSQVVQYSGYDNLLTNIYYFIVVPIPSGLVVNVYFNYLNNTDQSTCATPNGGSYSIDSGTIIGNITNHLKILTLDNTSVFIKGKLIEPGTYISEPFILVLVKNNENVIYYPFNMYNNYNKTKICFNTKVTVKNNET